MRIPEELARQVEVFHGEAGRAWIADLPRILAELEGRWSLTLHEPFPGIWYNVVAPATRYGTVPVVLKVGFPREELFTELDALRLYGGHGAVKLLEADELLGALLLERVRPGRELVELEDDDRSTRIAAGVMRAIQRPPPLDHRFPTVDRWATRGMQNLRTTFDGGTGPFPRRLVEQAESIFADLLPTQEGRVVLHGDLHHWNILSSAREPWLAIDPKGVVGEPAYETGAWLRNPNTTLLSKPDVAGTLARRIAILSEELGVECERIRYWGIAQAVLSAWWSYEDATGGEQFGVRVAEILAGL